MPTYQIEQYELHVTKYRVEAGSEAEAIDKLLAGKAEPVEQSQDFVEVAEDYGLPADEYPELADALRDRGRMRGKDELIPSIRSIEQVEA